MNLRFYTSKNQGPYWAARSKSSSSRVCWFLIWFVLRIALVGVPDHLPVPDYSINRVFACFGHGPWIALARHRALACFGQTVRSPILDPPRLDRCGCRLVLPCHSINRCGYSLVLPCPGIDGCGCCLVLLSDGGVRWRWDYGIVRRHHRQVMVIASGRRPI
jgi:hypothetical protein